jgi:type II secretory ATPase GspE/PulE/Tfp pilus assembly ATPase PilB-like protein
MRTLRQDGMQKVLMGQTTYGEVVRVTQQEELPED